MQSNVDGLRQKYIQATRTGDSLKPLKIYLEEIIEAVKTIGLSQETVSCKRLVFWVITELLLSP